MLTYSPVAVNKFFTAGKKTSMLILHFVLLYLVCPYVLLLSPTLEKMNA